MSKSNRQRLPWRVWDQHVVDCDDKAVAFNVGVERAKFIVELANAKLSSGS